LFLLLTSSSLSDDSDLENIIQENYEIAISAIEHLANHKDSSPIDIEKYGNIILDCAQKGIRDSKRRSVLIAAAESRDNPSEFIKYLVSGKLGNITDEEMQDAAIAAVKKHNFENLIALLHKKVLRDTEKIVNMKNNEDKSVAITVDWYREMLSKIAEYISTKTENDASKANVGQK
jgi:hypothetical protein